MAGASSAPPYPSSQHSVPTGMGSMTGCQVADPAAAAALDTNPHARSLMKLTAYDGNGSLETFLKKFGCMAQYLDWKEGDMFHHLCASLEGNAGQVLWDLNPGANTATVIALLRTRFGHEMHAERFRAELQARRCKPGESLQSLYLDISRMSSLAHPVGVAVPELAAHVAKEAFVTALDDASLQLKLMEKEPDYIEAALRTASKFEAYQSALHPKPTTGSRRGEGTPLT